MQTQELIEYLNDFNREHVKETETNEKEILDLGIEWLA